MMKKVGKIIGISELNVKILMYDKDIKLKDILTCELDGDIYKFEVVEIEGEIAQAIPFGRVIGLKKGVELQKQEGGLQMEYSKKILGRVFDPFGNPIDEEEIESEKKKNVYERKLTLEEILLLYKKDLKWGY